MRFAALVTVFVASAIAAPVNFAAPIDDANGQGMMIRRRSSVPDAADVLNQPAAAVVQSRSPEPKPGFFSKLGRKFKGVARFAKGAVGFTKKNGGSVLNVVKDVGGAASVVAGGSTGAITKAASSGFFGKMGGGGGGGGGGGAKPGGIGAVASLLGGGGPASILRQAAAGILRV